MYQSEAHASGSWHARDAPIMLAQAKSLAERLAAVAVFKEKLKPVGTVVADNMSNGASRAFSAYPNRLVILNGGDGTIAYTQFPGPFAYNGLQALAWLTAWAGKQGK